MALSNHIKIRVLIVVISAINLNGGYTYKYPHVALALATCGNMVSAMWKIALFFTCLLALGAAAPGYPSAFPSLTGIYYYKFILISKCTDIKFKILHNLDIFWNVLYYKHT